MKKFFNALMFSALLLSTNACDTISCGTAMTIVDLIYGTFGAFAPQGYAVGKTFYLDRIVKNFVAGQVDDCNNGTVDRFEEEMGAWYRPNTSAQWQRLPNGSSISKMSNFDPNESCSVRTPFTPQTPGYYSFGFRVDDPNQVGETDENNNGGNSWQFLGFAGSADATFDIEVKIIDPTGQLQPVNDVNDVQFEIGTPIITRKK